MLQTVLSSRSLPPSPLLPGKWEGDRRRRVAKRGAASKLGVCLAVQMGRVGASLEPSAGRDYCQDLWRIMVTISQAGVGLRPPPPGMLIARQV